MQLCSSLRARQAHKFARLQRPLRDRFREGEDVTELAIPIQSEKEQRDGSEMEGWMVWWHSKSRSGGRGEIAIRWAPSAEQEIGEGEHRVWLADDDFAAISVREGGKIAGDQV